MFRCCSLETSHPRLLPQSLKDCSINLCLFFFFCSAYRVIIICLFMTGLLSLMSSKFIHVITCDRISSPFKVELYFFWMYTKFCLFIHLLLLLLFSLWVMSGSLQSHGLQYVRLPNPSLSPRVCSSHLSANGHSFGSFPPHAYCELCTFHCDSAMHFPDH